MEGLIFGSQVCIIGLKYIEGKKLIFSPAIKSWHFRGNSPISGVESVTGSISPTIVANIVIASMIVTSEGVDVVIVIVFVFIVIDW